jgi:hypothetical protein
MFKYRIYSHHSSFNGLFPDISPAKNEKILIWISNLYLLTLCNLSDRIIIVLFNDTFIFDKEIIKNLLKYKENVS